MHRAGRLDGKVAIVTGAAGGIGSVLVRALRDAGAKVAALDVEEADVSDYAACERAVRDTIARLGGLHIVINNAALGLGVIRADHQKRLIGIDEISPEMWQRFVATNFSGAWNMTRAAIGHLRAQRWGRIINVTTSFFTMLRGGFHPYGPCKAGLEAMSAGHAEEFAGTGVTVNVVIPGGPVDTPMIPSESGYERGTLIRPEVMAPPVLWLCAEAAGGVTGKRLIAQGWSPGEPVAPAGWPGLGPPMVTPR
ncbi:MAG: SDR family NAD(P)-dependent oxidoreductase [Betaproteobacteria bacterium]